MRTTLGADKQSLIHEANYSEAFAGDLLSSQVDPLLFGAESDINLYTVLKAEIEKLKATNSRFTLFSPNSKKGESLKEKEDKALNLEKRFYTIIKVGESLETLDKDYHFKKAEFSSPPSNTYCVIS